MTNKKQPNKRWTDESEFTDKELGIMYGWLGDIHDAWTAGKGCPCGVTNRNNIKWMWTVMCFYGVSCLAGFKFLYGAIDKLEVIATNLSKVTP